MPVNNQAEPVLVSVCIPVYNGEAYISDTIKSVLSQTYGYFEIIITDNCSNDRTAEIVASFSDNRIRYYLNETNLGMAGNWNRAIKYAQGEYIKLLCADDILHANALHAQVTALNSHDDVSLIIGASAVIDESSKIVLIRKHYKHDRLFDGKRIAKQSLRGRNILGEPSTTLFRKESYNIIGGYDLGFVYCTDWDLHLRLAYLGNVYYLSDILTNYRVSLSSATSDYYRNRRHILLDDTYKIVAKHQKMGIVTINAYDVLLFRLLTTFFMFARHIFLSFRVG